jgi:hypothetical protein
MLHFCFKSESKVVPLRPKFNPLGVCTRFRRVVLAGVVFTTSLVSYLIRWQRYNNSVILQTKTRQMCYYLIQFNNKA